MPGPYDLTVFTGGTVWTGAADAGALAVRGDRIAALGDAARHLAGGGARTVDLAGGFLMPAFGDGHAHPLFGGLESRGPRIKGLATIEEIAAEVGRYAAAHPELEWIAGGSYDPAIVPGGAFDARWLDAAVPDRPVALRAYDYHTVWCNSAALARAGIGPDTPDPRLGWIDRRPDGSPLGTLREWHACDLVLDLIPGRPAGDLTAALAEASRVMAAAGITWVQDAWVEPDMVDPYLAAARDGALGLRANLALRADPDRWREQRATFAGLRRAVESPLVEGQAAPAARALPAHPAAPAARPGGPLVTARTVKFFADGVIEGGTAALLDPYDDAPHSCGMPVWEPAALAEAVTAFDSDGFQAHIHAIGDAGVRAALDAVEAAAAANPGWDRRPVIAHTQLVDPADLPRFAALGVIANFEPLWARLDPLQTELTIPRIGGGRAALQYPMAGLARSGARLSFGSDWPVSSYEPLAGIQVAVTRRTFDGSPSWLPEQRLAVEEALRAYTAGVAYQAFDDHRRGVLAPGADADLAWLGADPRTTDPGELRHIPVLGTWLAGHRVHG